MIPADELEHLCYFILIPCNWERLHAPLFTPQIGLDVLLYATACDLAGNPACAIDLHLVLKVSKDGVRQVTRLLGRDGLIVCGVDANDSRLKRLLPTLLDGNLFGITWCSFSMDAGPSSRGRHELLSGNPLKMPASEFVFRPSRVEQWLHELRLRP